MRVLTGLAMVLMKVAHVRLGFSFSAGLFDYVLNYGKASRPLALLPIGFAYFAVYYLLFRTCIVRFDLKTPGREAQAADRPVPTGLAQADQGAAFVAALGGESNLQRVDACTTRLRLVVSDASKVDRRALARLGARGVIEPGPGLIQVVIGPTADQVAERIRSEIRITAKEVPEPPANVPLSRDAISSERAHAFIVALGGRGNIRRTEIAADRLLVDLKNAGAMDEATLMTLGVRGVARPDGALLQLLMGRDAVRVHAGIASLLAPAAAKGDR